MVRRSAQTVIAIGMALAASLALGTTSSAHAATSAAKPKVGQCRAMSYKRTAAISDTSKPVPCSKRHTAVTVAVVEARTSLAGLAQDQLDTLGAELCSQQELKKLGRSPARRAMSAYNIVFFQPTATQIRAGARWFRCDLTLKAGKNMLPLPGHLPRPVLPKHPTDQTEHCLTGTHLSTPCSSKHAYRPVRAFTFKPVAYPTGDDFVQAGDDLCPAGGNAYYTWSNPSVWAAGDRVLVCYTKTEK